MSPELAVAGVALLAVIAYGVLAGADFGGGVWDAFARGPRAEAQRGAIAHAMGPVWEANHVWLIFVIVLLFTAFPPAFSLLTRALFVPFHLVLLGIILRGAAFVFRSPQSRLSGSRWGVVFGIASVVTPVLLGMLLGAISSGRMHPAGDAVLVEGVAWLSPISLAMGALALAICAYLAAVFLTVETSGELREDFRRRALVAGTFVVAIAAVTMPVTYFDSPHLWDELMHGRATPIVLAGVAFALASGVAILRRNYRLSRATSVLQVVLLLLGWAVAQYPYLVYPGVTIAEAAAPEPTLRFLLWTLPVGAVLLVPSLWLLFRVFKRT